MTHDSTCRCCGAGDHNIRTCKDPRAAALARKPARKKRSPAYIRRKRARERDRRKEITRQRNLERELERMRYRTISVAALHAEGVVEVGCAVGAALFVLTRVKLHLIHAHSLPGASA